MSLLLTYARCARPQFSDGRPAGNPDAAPLRSARPFRTETNMPTLTTCLWFDDQALDTAG
jgi:hypothetical protein